MKTLLFIGILYQSFSSFSQNGYVQQTIVSEDTTSLFIPEQIFWKLQVGETYYLIESKLGEFGNRRDVKHPIVSREYDGYIKEFVISGGNNPNFTIQFHTGDHVVSYIYNDKRIEYKGEHINFSL